MSGSMLYLASTSSWTYQRGLLVGGLEALTAISWIFLSICRLDIPDAFSRLELSGGEEFGDFGRLEECSLPVSVVVGVVCEDWSFLAPQWMRKVLMIRETPMVLLCMMRMRSGTAGQRREKNVTPSNSRTLNTEQVILTAVT